LEVRPGVLGPTGRPVPIFPDPEPLLTHGPARVVAVCNQKGGVGKTTTTINLGAALAEHGRRVLLVDFDPQGALSVGLGIQPHELDATVYNLLMERNITARDVLFKTNVDGMDLLPSNIDLSGAEVQLVHEVGREFVLGRVLAPVIPDYDVILIDCQPSLGLLTVNALACADGVIVPLECEYFALRGVALLMETIEKVSSRISPKLVLDGLLATMYDSRTLHTREVLAGVVKGFGDKVYHTVISRTVRFPDSSVAGEPITRFDPTSNGATAYRELAKEVLDRWHQADLAVPVHGGSACPESRNCSGPRAGARPSKPSVRPAAGSATPRRSPSTCPAANCSTWSGPGSRCGLSALPWTGAGTSARRWPCCWPTWTRRARGA
jgi:chromosome partitioning protein